MYSGNFDFHFQTFKWKSKMCFVFLSIIIYYILYYNIIYNIYNLIVKYW